MGEVIDSGSVWDGAGRLMIGGGGGVGVGVAGGVGGGGADPMMDERKAS